MKVFVVGANGQIGKHLVRLLGESKEHSVKAMVRNPDQAQSLEQLGAETVVADLEGTVTDIKDAAKGCDAIVFTAGSGGKTGADKTLLIDLDGAVKTIEAAEEAGISRFVMVSAIGAHKRENWNEKIKHYFVAKHFADRALLSSSLNYTIIRPGGLTNDAATGQVNVKEELPRANIPREDVAAVIFASLDEERTYKRGFDVTSGDHSIPSALQSL